MENILFQRLAIMLLFLCEHPSLLFYDEIGFPLTPSLIPSSLINRGIQIIEIKGILWNFTEIIHSKASTGSCLVENASISFWIVLLDKSNIVKKYRVFFHLIREYFIAGVEITSWMFRTKTHTNEILNMNDRRPSVLNNILFP